MIEKQGYILWDDTHGYRFSKVYLDIESAKIGLREHYAEFWLLNGRAKIETIKLVSYVDGGKEK